MAKYLLKEGILPGFQLVYKASTMTGDYHGQIKHNSFSNWMSVNVISNFLPLSVIMFKTAPKHSYGTQKTSSFHHGQRKQWKSQWCPTTLSTATTTMVVLFPVPEQQSLLGTLPPPPLSRQFLFYLCFLYFLAM